MELLTKAKMLSAFRDVARRLQFQRVEGELYVVGGAAVALAYDDSRLTKDVDALFVRGHGAVVKAGIEVGRERGWDDSWLNEQPAAFIPKDVDAGANTVFVERGLVARAAAPRRLIAMKLLAGRPQDVNDMAVLIPFAPELRTADDLIALFDRLMPEEFRRRSDLEQLHETARLALEKAGLL